MLLPSRAARRPGIKTSPSSSVVPFETLEELASPRASIQLLLPDCTPREFHRLLH